MHRCVAPSHAHCASLQLSLLKTVFLPCLTLWLCSDSCHTCGVPGQKWPDSKQLLINLSLCYIITKYWIQSFCQLVFFHLGLVLCFYLHLINRKPHLSESRHLIFEWKNHFLWIIFTIWDKKLWKFALFLTLVYFNVYSGGLVLNAFILYKIAKSHTCGVPGQKWPDSDQLLINLSLCCIFTKYWIQSFCQIVFFHLGLVLCFYLHLINRKPHLSESRHLIFWVKKAFFMNNIHNMS